jgi:hypothetical protein
MGCNGESGKCHHRYQQLRSCKWHHAGEENSARQRNKRRDQGFARRYLVMYSSECSQY